MPYVRRSGYKRRAPRRRGYASRKSRAMVRKAPMYRRPKLVSSGFPEVKYCKLKYCTVLNMPAGGGAFGTHHFRTNSLFDPDYTAVGHQPYGFDNWAAVYSKYEVLSSYITVRFVGTQASPSTIVGVEVLNDFDPSLTLDLVRERPSSYTKVLTPQFPTKITRRWSFRRNAPRSSEFENTATVITDPANSDYFRIFVASTDGSSLAASVNAVITINYVAKFWERQNLFTS